MNRSINKSQIGDLLTLRHSRRLCRTPAGSLRRTGNTSGSSAGASREPNLYSGTGNAPLNNHYNPTEFNLQNGAVNSCWSPLSKKGGYSGINKKNNDKYLQTNNPVTNELIVFGKDISLTYITCFDAIGKAYKLSIISNSENETKFDVESLAVGMYFINIDNQTLKFIKLKN